MSNKRGQHVDKTYLSLELAEDRGFLHRDYIAHCLRWSHVIKELTRRKAYQDAVILDIGCGRELPLPKTMYSSRLIPLGYVGVDAGPINDDAADTLNRTGKFPNTLFEKQDIMGVEPKDMEFGLANFVTCFEVAEHVEPMHLWKILHHIKTLTTEDCTFFFSTPCWNVSDTAANHVNEIKFDVLGSMFLMAGYGIRRVWGTFASQREIQPVLSETNKQLFEQLKEYYDSNVLSCIFAPIHPGQSRNALWELTKHQQNMTFPDLTDIPEPWGSGDWEPFKQEVL